MAALATLRPISAGTGAISAGVGSAIFEMGNTRVLCALYGPHVDVRQEFSERGRLACEVKIASFARPGRSGVSAAADESALAEELQTALAPAIQLEAYPKCSWQLCAFVIEDDGSALAALVSCGALALADAGVQMFDLVAACSAACTPHGEVDVMPTAAQELGAHGQLLLAKMASSGKASSLQASGLVPPELFNDAYAAADAGCAEIAKLMRSVLST